MWALLVIGGAAVAGYSAWRSCPGPCTAGHAAPVTACTTCGATPDRHRPSCLCQAFATVCSRCGMRLL